MGSVVVGLLVAAASAVGVWFVWRVFVTTYTGQRVDQVVFEGSSYGRGRLWRIAEPVLDVVSVPYIALVLLAAVLIATLRRRWELAVQVAVLMGGANLTTQVLKYWVFDRPELGISPGSANALPSGHTTAAASVSAALVFVVPPRLRPWAAVLGAGYTSATGVSTLVGRWHRPSDVVAAILVVLAWSGLACALTTVSRGILGPSRTPPGDGDPTGADPDMSATAAIALRGAPARNTARVIGGMLVLAAVGTAVPAAIALRQVWFAPDAPATGTELLTGYIGGALGVVAASCLAFAILLAVRELAGRAAGPTAGRGV
ncbi:phosphatase PAP2 family protein [Cellulomonas sp. ATA003]|uniref:phosphatase PAP2 family protein n=1 Tax=Cellulomonas sp. ATA003 TaxID=3073064 RepID=UPI0028735877|nr:phosphatase PAP2 family protein [Cellulomonas sp. ATA003]WNB85348.1 phosphatase PAP2 family protein [Cellulomonas sp. ATA003]